MIKGRGTDQNPANRFERLRVIPDLEQVEYDAEYLEKLQHPLTQYLCDSTKSIIASNDSPDVPFTRSINPYRGCSHGCIYCFARPTHEYLGMSAGLDFETKIMVKHEAPELLRAELSAKKWVPEVIACSGVTDCYQPIERKLCLTRRCLEVLREFRNPVCIVTKNHLVTRDIDILREMGTFECSQVFISVTTLDPHLTQIMEPRTSVPKRRLRAIRELSEAGIPVGVLVATVIPGLTDHEMAGILQAAKDAGAVMAGMVPLRLPWAVKDLFSDWLEQHFPDRKEKVLNRVRSIRGGKLNDPEPHTRMRGEGLWAEQLQQMFKLHTGRLGLNERAYHLSTAHFRGPMTKGEQLDLFVQPASE